MSRWDDWDKAVAWFEDATEAEIDAVLARPEHERERRDWMRLACVALDQAGMFVDAKDRLR